MRQIQITIMHSSVHIRHLASATTKQGIQLQPVVVLPNRTIAIAHRTVCT
jgi:hypothetical protein